VRWLVLLVAGCGSTAPAIAPTAPPAPISLAAPAPVTCGDAGVILRGKVDQATHGPTKEATIASACLLDRWPIETLECIGTSAQPDGCLDKLTEDQRHSYELELAQWAETFGETIEKPRAVLERRASCAGAIADVGAYPPALTVTGEDRDFAIALRQDAIELMCNAGWPNAARTCFEHSGAECKRLLPGNLQLQLANKLAEIDALVAKVIAAKAKPAASYDCKQVVATHYSDAAWKPHPIVVVDPKATKVEQQRAAAERKKVIADARAALLATCANESWSGTVRACIAIGAGDVCFRGIGLLPVSWGFPPPGAVRRTGIAECDTYATTTARLTTCTQLPKDVREAMRVELERDRHLWGAANADDRTVYAASCRASEDGLRRMAVDVGCPL
jgi:hypothetical protein